MKKTKSQIKKENKLANRISTGNIFACSCDNASFNAYPLAENVIECSDCFRLWDMPFINTIKITQK